jgi:hypothetical protein
MGDAQSVDAGPAHYKDVSAETRSTTTTNFPNAYDPETDDYDPCTIVVLPPVDPPEKMMREQISALRRRVEAGGDASVIDHYRKVIDEMQKELDFVTKEKVPRFESNNSLASTTCPDLDCSDDLGDDIVNSDYAGNVAANCFDGKRETKRSSSSTRLESDSWFGDEEDDHDDVHNGFMSGSPVFGGDFVNDWGHARDREACGGLILFECLWNDTSDPSTPRKHKAAFDELGLLPF